ncbi:MAG: hypothetical protein U0838_03765 [Chloroflexota bacterium]
MAELPSEPALDPRVRAYLDAELRRAEDDFTRLPMPTGQASAERRSCRSSLRGSCSSSP